MTEVVKGNEMKDIVVCTSERKTRVVRRKE